MERKAWSRISGCSIGQIKILTSLILAWLLTLWSYLMVKIFKIKFEVNRTFWNDSLSHSVNLAPPSKKGAFSNLNVFQLKSYISLGFFNNHFDYIQLQVFYFKLFLILLFLKSPFVALIYIDDRLFLSMVSCNHTPNSYLFCFYLLIQLLGAYIQLNKNIYDCVNSNYVHWLGIDSI